MTKKRITITAEGNSHYVENVVHELSKLVSEGNQRPEIHISMDTQDVVAEKSVEFTTGSEQ